MQFDLIVDSPLGAFRDYISSLIILMKHIFQNQYDDIIDKISTKMHIIDFKIEVDCSHSVYCAVEESILFASLCPNALL